MKEYRMSSTARNTRIGISSLWIMCGIVPIMFGPMSHSEASGSLILKYLAPFSFMVGILLCIIGTTELFRSIALGRDKFSIDTESGIIVGLAGHSFETALLISEVEEVVVVKKMILGQEASPYIQFKLKCGEEVVLCIFQITEEQQLEFVKDIKDIFKDKVEYKKYEDFRRK